MGRWTTMIGVLISVGTAYLVMQFASIMDYVQALFSFFIAPLFGTVVLGMLVEAGDRRGRILGPAVRNTLLHWHVGLGENRSFGAALCCAFAARQRAGAGYVSGAVVFCGVRDRDRNRESGDQAHGRWQLIGLVYGLTKVPSVGDVPLYQKPLFWAEYRHRSFLRVEYYFLVSIRSQRLLARRTGHGFDLVLHRHFAGGERRTHPGRRNLPVGVSPGNPGVVLFHLHANVWWGAALLLGTVLIGLVYTSNSAPKRQS
jgi:hypothetical protein